MTHLDGAVVFVMLASLVGGWQSWVFYLMAAHHLLALLLDVHSAVLARRLERRVVQARARERDELLKARRART